MAAKDGTSTAARFEDFGLDGRLLKVRTNEIDVG